MASQYNLDKTYLKMALSLSELSNAKRAKVGCLIVKNTHIISEGINGMPSGFINDCENKLNETNPEVLHAESNAITKVARSTQSTEGSTLYITLAPCFDCSKLIIQSGIIRVVYLDDYRIMSGIDLLKKANIEIIKFNKI